MNYLIVEEMQVKLDKYFEQIQKVKILRSPARQGIMMTRMLGVVNAKGPVLVFLDSHVEVMHGWLEPVLDRFKNQNELLVTMWHLTLDKHSLKFDDVKENKPYWIGGFFWNMDFAFISIQSYEGDNPTPTFDPKQSPTIFGSMHSIRKDYFIKLGMYDKGETRFLISRILFKTFLFFLTEFDVWGGEDIE